MHTVTSIETLSRPEPPAIRAESLRKSHSLIWPIITALLTIHCLALPSLAAPGGIADEGDSLTAGANHQAASAGQRTEGNQVLPQLTWQTLPVQQTATSHWYRCLFQDSSDSAKALLTIAADGTVSAYCNGQRLLRQHAFTSVEGKTQAMAFDITELLRKGRNSVAFEIRPLRQTATLATAVTVTKLGQATQTIAGEWRTVDTLPPVGWQQTDFNARDWKVVPNSLSPPSDGLNVIAANRVIAAVNTPGARRVPFHLRDGDHVVMIGATFLERAQQFGHLESALTASYPDLNLTFRNLGWDADTVFAESRGIFDAPEVGYLRMIEHVRAEEPTVVLLNYGQNEALAANRDANTFRSQLERLLDDLATTGATIVLVTPTELLPAVRPIPDPSRFNPQLQEFAQIIQSVAADKQLSVVNLFDNFAAQLNTVDRRLGLDEVLGDATVDLSQHPDLQPVAASRWSDNGMHFNDRGYLAASLVVRDRLLGMPATGCQITIDAASEKINATGGSIRNVQWNSKANTLVSFDLKEEQLVALPAVVTISETAAGMGWSGSVSTADPATPQAALIIRDQSNQLWIPAAPEYFSLRDAVVRKNELYFHRWRPQNITYLFGFRKHEQGNNAAEIAQFDPIIREVEEQIKSLKQTVWRTVTINRR